MPGFYCLTFGCQMNINDSDWLARGLRRKGFVETSLERADVIFVNTCSVRDKPEQKVHSALGRIKRENPGAVVGVAGCVAQQLGNALMDRHKQVRLVLGSDGVIHAPDAFERLLSEPDLRLSFLDFTDSYPDRNPFLEQTALPGQQAQATAYVNIMQGCDNFCAYCIVPFTRGPRKSRSTQAVLDECQAWLERGAAEIVLLGQNVNTFGQDKHGDGTSFAQLLYKLAELPGLGRLQFITSHPKDFSKDTVRAFAELPVLSSRLHLPLQAGADQVLSAMRRGYDRKGFMRLVEQLRTARADLALSTDLIVGFPGETEQDFAQTLSAIEEADFMSSFSFCYSDRPGTRAARMLDKIPKEVQLERLERLQELQNKKSEAWLQSRTGKVTEVILDSPSPRRPQGQNLWQGKDYWGDTVHVNLPEALGKTGNKVSVRIREAKKHSLLADLEF